MKLIIVTGLSGAGKSIAVNALEDIGFFVVENIPANLLSSLVKNAKEKYSKEYKLAVTIDIRGGRDLKGFYEALSDINASGTKYKTLFLNAEDNVLLNRFRENRRRHPLSIHYGLTVSEAISEERKSLQKLYEAAHYIIDTSNYSVSALREKLICLLTESSDGSMVLSVSSFGFKFGAPTDADIILDVRCLPNPFYILELRDLTGKDSKVSEYVMSFAESKELFHYILQLIKYSIPLYTKEGKSQLSIAFGCTGGKHRSITFALELKKALENMGYKPVVFHRDEHRK